MIVGIDSEGGWKGDLFWDALHCQACSCKDVKLYVIFDVFSARTCIIVSRRRWSGAELRGLRPNWAASFPCRTWAAAKEVCSRSASRESACSSPTARYSRFSTHFDTFAEGLVSRSTVKTKETCNAAGSVVILPLFGKTTCKTVQPPVAFSANQTDSVLVSDCSCCVSALRYVHSFLQGPLKTFPTCHSFGFVSLLLLHLVFRRIIFLLVFSTSLGFGLTVDYDSERSAGDCAALLDALAR